MREPLFQRGDSGRAMSRIPFGGCAVLDIAHPLHLQVKGALQKKAVRFHSDRNTLVLRHASDRHREIQFRRLGLGDFVCALRAPGDPSWLQLACQMEAPNSRRTPIMHLVEPISAYQSANKSETVRSLIRRCRSLNRLEVNSGTTS